MAKQKTAAFDTTVPNVARIYDFWLGGKDNFAADREAGNKLIRAVPYAALAARANRAFLRRVVRVLAAEEGIQQFIDVGTGLPTAGNVHEIARQARPGARVVYVDNDPVVCAHGRALLASDETQIIEADLRHPEEIINHPQTRELIDFTQPFALMFTSVLHFVPDDDDVRAVIARFRDVMAPGSYLVVSHVSHESRPDDLRAKQAAEVYSQSSAPLTLRSVETVRSFFDGFDLIEPGLPWVSEWRPNPSNPSEHVKGVTESMRGGVGRKVS
ncbi:MAG TPA: SAM-dependent methyltransferase [Streptosporangiaceae bacterium]|nr:SAM-dependent methyltransferase [Streptosporangiaceae bacterium]